MKRRILSVVMAVVIMVSVAPVGQVSVSAAPSSSEIKSKIDQMEGWWAGGSIYPNSGSYVCPSGWASATCYAFADNVYHELFGSCIGRDRGNAHTNANNLCIGDHVRYRSSDSTDHSIIITNIVGDTIYYSDSNGAAGANKVYWDASVSRATLQGWINQQLVYTGNYHCTRGYIQNFPGNEVRSLDATRADDIGGDFFAVIVKHDGTVLTNENTIARQTHEYTKCTKHLMFL